MDSEITQAPELAQVDENFARAVPAAILAAILGAIIWAAVGYFSGMSLGLIAILVGAMVGYAVRRVGKGTDRKFGYLGGAAAAFGWALGTWLCDIGLLAKEVGRPILDVFASIGLTNSVAFAFRAADVMDLLFLAFAVYEGYRFALRHRTTS
jgi:hypothetical protein